MGSGSSVPLTVQPAEGVSDEQILRCYDDNARLVTGANILTPRRNLFFRTMHCQIRSNGNGGEEEEGFDSIAKVCFVRDVDLARHYHVLKVHRQLLTAKQRDTSPNVLSYHGLRYGAVRNNSNAAHTPPPKSKSPPAIAAGASTPPMPSATSSSTEVFSPTFLVRQYMFANLKDRLATRPFLGEFEKRWIAYSLLCAVKQLHACGICHGDIKTENVLLTSWGWVVLADMAPFKPTYLEAEQSAAAFNFYFSTGKKRCYLAPERFVKSSYSNEAAAGGGQLDARMDLFALGMVLIEIFNVDGPSGETTFELSDALEYSARGSSARLNDLLTKVADADMRRMCASLTSRDPAQRMSIQDCLALFPPSIPNLVYPLMHSMLLREGEGAQEHVLVWRTCEAYQEILAQLSLRDEAGEALCNTLLKTRAAFAPAMRVNVPGSEEKEQSPSSLPLQEEDAELSKVRDCIEEMQRVLQSGSNSSSTQQRRRRQSMPATAVTSQPLPADNCLVVLISYLGVCALKSQDAATRLVAMLLLKQFALLTRSDELTLSRVIPYIAHALSAQNGENSVLCRCLAIEILVELLDSLHEGLVPNTEQRYFPDYLFPLLEKCSRDASPSVRVTFAKHLAALAGHAKLFLECARTAPLPPPPPQPPSSQQQAGELNYDAELSVLREFCQRMMQKLTAEQASTSAVDFAIKKALIASTFKLCLFFGRDRIEAWLLPWLLSIFNQWPLQLAGLKVLASIGAFVGSEAFHLFLFPVLEDMLCSSQDLVVEAAANCLDGLVRNGLISPKGKLYKLTESILPLVRHPSLRVRRAVLRVLASIFTALEHVDVQLFLVEHMRAYFAPPPGWGSKHDVLLVLGREGMTWKQTLALLDTLHLQQAPHTSLQRWAKEYNKPIAVAQQVQASAAASSGKGKYPLHALTVDESLGGGGGARQYYLPPTTPLQQQHPLHWHLPAPPRAASKQAVCSKYGLVDTPQQHMHGGVSSDVLLRRIRALGLTELKYNLNRQGGALLYDDAATAAMRPAPPANHQREWRIRGNLVTPLLEHTAAVQRVQVSEDHSFFTTGSDDGTVKLWVCAKLDRNPCPKSRITFAIPGGSRVVDLCTIKHTSSFAVASADGQISLIRSDGPGEAFKHASLGCAPPSNAGAWDDGGAVVGLAVPSCNDLFCATARGRLYHWDLRSGQRLLDTLVLPPGLGSMSAIASSHDNTWLVLGTHRGVVAVFDLRYNLLLAAWRHPYSHPIFRLHVSKTTVASGKPLVFVCVGRNQTILLNLETGETALAMACAQPELGAELDTWKQNQETLFASKFSRVDLDSRQIVDRYIREAQVAFSNAPPYFSMRAVLVPADVTATSTFAGQNHPNSVLTAGTDMTVRYWDLRNNTTSAASSALVTAPLVDPDNKPRWEVRRNAIFCLPSISASSASSSSTSAGKTGAQHHHHQRFVVRTAHSDAILDLGVVRMRDSRYLLITAGRDGAVKLWQ